MFRAYEALFGGSELFSLGGLTTKQKGLRQRTLAAELERTEILEPIARYHPVHLLAWAIHLYRVPCAPKTPSEFDKLPLLVFLRLDAVLDQLNKHPRGTKRPRFRYGPHLGRRLGRTVFASVLMDTIGCNSGAMRFPVQ